jgi:UDP-N-acetylmuramate--alanine ligase
MLGKTEKIHFIGIGGIGMSGLAAVFNNLGFKVSGSDISRSEITRNLSRMGVRIYYRHSRRNIAGADVAVYSTAIRPDNPETGEARRLGIPLIHRGELLAELTRIKTSVCISGTHGKTTTTSLVSEVLLAGGLRPTAVIGGIVMGKSQARVGKGEYLVCEADESDKSFLKLLPAYAVITNIEPEHLEHYKNFEEIKESFIHFANHVPFWGCVFLGSDTPANREVRDRIRRKTVYYGFNGPAELRATGIVRHNFGSRFQVSYFGRTIGNFSIRLPGRHNVANCLAAIGIGLELGVPAAKIRAALAGFKGVHRRIECVAEFGSVKVFDDYGHHPTEIAVTLQTLREYFPERRIISVFQPHRYTRTYYLFDQFARAFLHADMVIVTEIYPAHELPIPGVTGQTLATRIRKEQEGIFYEPDFDLIVKRLKKTIRPGDIVVIQGAGNINQVANTLVRELK